MLNTPRDRFFIASALGVLAGDIVSKRMIEARLPLHIPQEVIGQWLRFTLTYNKGAAMNMTLGASNRVIFSALAVVMIVILVRMWRGLPSTDRLLPLALGMITAGAAGNLIDRLRGPQGVVDFIDVGIGDSRFWIFNVADSGVTVGAVLLALLTWKEPQPAAPAPTDPTPAEQTSADSSSAHPAS